ncbi:hypothetical protein L916_18955, partial [Phytophthora nicotianae]
LTLALAMSKANSTSSYSSSSLSISAQTRHWAASMTKTWADEVHKEWRLELRRQSSKRFRARKQQALAQLRREQDHLELKIRQCIAARRRLSTDIPSGPSELSSSLRRLAIEGDSLTRENLQLKQDIYKHEFFRSITSKAIDGNPRRDEKNPQNILEASKKSRWVAYDRLRYSGWCVEFPNHEPSFFFYPFTRTEFDDVIKTTLAGLGSDSLVVGKVFGWNVHNAPLTHNAETGSLIAQVRLTTRVSCSLQDSDILVTTSDIHSWPLLITPAGWERSEHARSSTQVLQQLDLNSLVLVTNIPGQVHFRYLYLVRRWTRLNENGKREILYVTVIGDTEANAQAREPQSDVQWTHESGICIRYTEVNKSTIDVTYNRWSQCESEDHVQKLFIDWIQVLCWWTQRVTSSRLIRSG